MFVLIAGGGRTGSQLASLLLDQNHQVQRGGTPARSAAPTPPRAAHRDHLRGRSHEPQVLEQAGIRQAQVLAACTPNDADNLVLCYLARTRYQVPRTIAQINNPRNAWLFDDSSTWTWP